MNELDSEIMVGALNKKGLKRVFNEEDADILIFNTCSIRDLAERTVMGKIGQICRSPKGRAKVIGVTGCMAMAKKDNLLRKLPHVDFVLGTNNITDLSAVIDDVMRTGKPSVRVEDRFEDNLDYMVAHRDDKTKAFVSIIRGCDKFCTYCIVPYTRGKEVSRSPDSIVEECKKLAQEGYKEVTLLGQNVNSYGKDTPETRCLFHDLLYRLDDIDGLERVRFLTSHPIDISVELMQAIRDLPTLCEFVHFPIQAGSSRILKKMHRIYTKEQYFDKVQLLREIVPDVSLGTDIIVGFPGETEEEFQETVQAMKDIRYSVAFIYAFSPRKGTPAMRWKDDIPESVKNERVNTLLDLQRTIEAEQSSEMLGKTAEVLVENQNRDGRLKGRTRCWRKVVLEGDPSLVGQIVPVRLHSYNHQTLLGTIDNPSH